MGLFDFLKRHKRKEKVTTKRYTSAPRKLSYAEKERILVERVTTKDMMQFQAIPYALNFPVHKFIAEHAHPFAYINLVGPNISVAKSALAQMNTQLEAAFRLSPLIPRGIKIPIKEVLFTPSSEQGYTRLICSPYAFDGEISEFPVSLIFMTALHLGTLHSEKDSTHGELFYGKDGKISKANIYCWRNHEGYFFYYETINQSFVLSKVESTILTGGSPSVIYKDKYWIELEARRKIEREKYKWLQDNLPEICPKSFSGYMRMKNANTKNYQKIAAEAKKLGRNIE